MNTVHLFIFESLFSETFELHFENQEIESSSPKFVLGINLDNLEIAINDLKRQFTTMNIKIYLIDPKNRINNYYTPKGIEEYSKISNLIKTFDISVHYCDWEEFNKNLIYNPDDEYIFATQKSFSSLYDMVAYCDSTLDINRFYISNLNKIEDVINCQSPLDIFSIADMRQVVSNRGDVQFENQEEIRGLLRSGYIHLKYLILVGFLDGEKFVQQKAPSWIFNVENLFIKLIIYHNEMFPNKLNFGNNDTSSGKTIQEHFNESSEYRKVIVQSMCLTFYNFLLQRNLITPIEITQLWIFFKEGKFDSFFL
jgi:hypothetical protein